ncbi:LysR substrate-binding domain-containing protein [Ilumatobacter nonamiensis]|uniref:LysR substrate-binding domain-containing protein n=1 Tax=Ilumatobacter nonamiensis TaxID=467093 RepID=UPI000345333E|nr:LysR substrate-binding domain-containing protein [Ilumatobacter nonamiensis]
MRQLLRRVDRVQRLVVFEAAARLGSFTAAGDELAMTQPAVTRQVRLLERSLGVELFRRSANRIALTERGHHLLAHVGAGLDRIEDGLGELVDHVGPFVLASHPGVAQVWLMPRIDELNEALSGLELRLWLFDGDGDLDHGSFDAVIRVGDGDFAGLDSKLLFPEVVVPIASPRFAELHGLSPASSAAEVYAAPFVHMDDGDHPWMGWSGWLAHFDITLRREPGRVLFHNYPMVLQRVLLGYGVGLGWRPLIDEYVEREALVVVGPEIQSTNGYYVAWPSGPPSPPVRALTDWLTAR